jgi:MFS superfamily sulfate permease-like transporter
MFLDVFQDAFIISIVAFASSISVADLYAKKHKYKISSNRELFALGMSNVVGSFFKCFVSCGALARTVVLEASGGKTQLVSIIASIIVMMVMLWISPLLETLPKACLGSIIIAAIINILKQLKDLPHYWRVDKIDFIIWVVTFLSTSIIDIDIGLSVGILTVLFFNTYRNQK